MKITYLIRNAAELWGGVKTVFEEANLLTDRGHLVTIVALTEQPKWIEIRCTFITTTSFSEESIPESDLVIGTYFATIEGVVNCKRGIPVHYCQGYEFDYVDNASRRELVHAAYSLPAEKITIAPHLTEKLRRIYSIEPYEVIYWTNTPNLFPVPLRSLKNTTIRIGLVGPAIVDWKDIVTGLRAIDLLNRSGVNLVCVRISNTEPATIEHDLPFPVEWHTHVPPEKMGDLYRSMDIFLGTSRGDEEGFFMPAIEAFSCGVPSVLTDIPCFRGYGTGEYALFVPPRDPVAMAKGVAELICDDDLRDRIREQALVTAQRFTPENHISELESCFISILKAHS